MFKMKASIFLLVSVLITLPAAVMAQPGKGGGVTTTAAGKGGTVTEASLVERYKNLAGGSEDNAKSLVKGLRSKAEIVLVGPSLGGPCKFPCRSGSAATEEVRFTPDTDAMGFGNVDIALALTEADLKAKSVSPIKPRHLKAALQGGEAGGVAFEGILARRAAGAGWGEIAKSLGFALK